MAIVLWTTATCVASGSMKENHIGKVLFSIQQNSVQVWNNWKTNRIPREDRAAIAGMLREIADEMEKDRFWIGDEYVFCKAPLARDFRKGQNEG